MNFDGKVVLITGASAGMGAGAARHFAELGAKVVIVGRNEQRLNQVADDIKAAGAPTPLAIVADITKDAECIISQTIEHFGRLDVLVNNAGIPHNDNIFDFKVEEFDRVFDTNVKAVAILTALAVPHLEKTKGNIVNVSSIAGIKAVPSYLSYCMSKGAINLFTKVYALDLAPKGIRVNSINPGPIRTSILKPLGVAEEDEDKIWDSLGEKCPLKRVGEVSDTAAAMAFLASDSASFLTGVLLPVDGGVLLSS